jgi:hypothetical protein
LINISNEGGGQDGEEVVEVASVQEGCLSEGDRVDAIPPGVLPPQVLVCSWVRVDWVHAGRVPYQRLLVGCPDGEPLVQLLAGYQQVVVDREDASGGRGQESFKAVTQSVSGVCFVHYLGWGVYGGKSGRWVVALVRPYHLDYFHLKKKKKKDNISASARGGRRYQTYIHRDKNRGKTHVHVRRKKDSRKGCVDHSTLGHVV